MQHISSQVCVWKLDFWFISPFLIQHLLAITSLCLIPLKVLQHVVDAQISHDVTVGVRKLIWHNLSPENLTIGHTNHRKRENLSTGCVSQKPVRKPYEHDENTASQRTMGRVTAAINYLRKVCLQTAMPSTWIHFNGGNGHTCLGT